MVRILILITLFFIGLNDIKKLEIPNKLNIVLLILGIILKGNNIEVIENSILGMGVYVLPFLFIYGYISDIIGKDAIGFGDVKLVVSFGYILGYENLFVVYSYFLLTFIIASVSGLIIGLLKKSWSFKLPFSPFIILSFLYFWCYKK